ncbi:hypothetical protein GY45DRAFT_1224631, partial [Cubamyces sp. BRFM 1775]
ETGRKETAKEFSKRIHRVVLRLPTAERQEGEGDRRGLEPPDRHVMRSSDDRTALAPRRTGLPPTGGGANESTESQARLVDHIADQAGGLHLEKEIRERYKEDPFYQDILTNPKHHKNFDVRDGLVLLKDRGRELLCVPNVLLNGRNVREIVIAHAHSLLAHLGPHKTLDLLRDHVWWKT